jgi:CRP-like cAMP-binding protein
VTEASRPRVDSLRAIPMFEGLDDDALGRVAAAATEFDVPAGHVLVQPGQEGSGLFILEDGKAEVEIGSRKLVCGPGECIGELSLLASGVVHTARVRATTPIRGLAIGRQDFVDLLHSEPKIAIGMLAVLAQRLVDTDQLLSRT